MGGVFSQRAKAKEMTGFLGHDVYWMPDTWLGLLLEHFDTASIMKHLPVRQKLVQI